MTLPISGVVIREVRYEGQCVRHNPKELLQLLRIRRPLHLSDVVHSFRVGVGACCMEYQTEEMDVLTLDVAFAVVEHQTMSARCFHQIYEVCIMFVLVSSKDSDMVCDAHGARAVFEDVIHPFLVDILAEVETKRQSSKPESSEWTVERGLQPGFIIEHNRPVPMSGVQFEEDLRSCQFVRYFVELWCFVMYVFIEIVGVEANSQFA